MERMNGLEEVQFPHMGGANRGPSTSKNRNNCLQQKHRAGSQRERTNKHEGLGSGNRSSKWDEKGEAVREGRMETVRCIDRTILQCLISRTLIRSQS